MSLFHCLSPVLRSHIAYFMSEANTEIEAIGSVFSAAIEVLNDTRPDDPMTVGVSHTIRDALIRFITLAMGEAEGGKQPDSVETLEAAGNQLLSLTPGLVSGLENAGLLDALKQLQHAIAGAAVWLARAGAQLHRLEPVANALAALANDTHEPERLARLGYLIGEVVAASDPGSEFRGAAYGAARPWYVLHINWGIVATRSRDTVLMKRAFDRMADNVPADLPAFLRQAMQKMERDAYPDDVKAVIREYHDR